MKLGDLAANLGCRLVGDPEVEITGVAGVEQAGPGEVTFLANPKYAAKAKETRAGAILLAEPLPGAAAASLISANPYLDFARAAGAVLPAAAPRRGIHPTASVAASARIGENASIGAVRRGRRARRHRPQRGAASRTS